jgi:hypothetical protein
MDDDLAEPARSKGLSELVRRARQDRERPVVHRHDIGDRQQLDGLSRSVRIHREVAADREEGQ